MTEILVGLGTFIALLITVSFYRILVGPTLYDRLLGVGAIGTYAVILLALIGFIFDRPSGFLDLAITYAILNFVGVVAIAKFLDLETAQGQATQSEGPQEWAAEDVSEQEEPA
jgi:multicomponent Na+:H+ antiporter subunit F